MSKEILMQFMGFESKAAAREYTFTVREASGGVREFTLTISHDSFTAHRVRFQDAPDVCALKLRREFALSENCPLSSHFDITDTELEDYRSTHTPQKHSLYGRRPAEES
jgi:hypothetical protein